MRSEGNIAKLRHGDIDAIITSPPYADTKRGGEVDEETMAERWDRAFKQTGEKWNSWGKTWKTKGRKRALKALGSGYSNSRDNIGNLPIKKCKGKETYLEAMLKVYSECFKVLKPNGLMIVVIKPFIRNKKPVDLPYHTWLLMRKVGFKLEKIYKLRLKQQSFWRLLYYRRHPNVPRLNHEYILICRKPLEP